MYQRQIEEDGTANMAHHNKVTGIVYRNICAEPGLEEPRYKQTAPPNVAEMDKARILWDGQDGDG